MQTLEIPGARALKAPFPGSQVEDIRPGYLKTPGVGEDCAVMRS